MEQTPTPSPNVERAPVPTGGEATAVPAGEQSAAAPTPEKMSAPSESANQNGGMTLPPPVVQVATTPVPPAPAGQWWNTLPNS